MSTTKMKHNVFHHDFSLVVSSSGVTFQGARAYIQKYIREVMPKGNNATTRVLLLSGSHGTRSGNDALSSLDCLSSEMKGMPNQTRLFYQEWCKFFKLQAEGEDPRVYDEDGKVIGIKDGPPPTWEARVPRLPGLWKKGLEHGAVDNENLSLKLIDVAWYSSKVQQLIEIIKDFQPTSLIIDWCHNREGFMMNQLTTSGIASRIRMETEMFLISRNKQICLSEEQKMILEDVENMELEADEGSVVFLHGPFGCGKTIIGIETGRILVSKRRQMGCHEKIEMIFCAESDSCDRLVESLMLHYVKTAEFLPVFNEKEMIQVFQLGDPEAHRYYRKDPVKFVSELPTCLSPPKDHVVLIIDEVGYENQDWRQLNTCKGLDLVVLPKQHQQGEIPIQPPMSTKFIRVHEMTNAYRQAPQPFAAYKYVMTHAQGFPSSWTNTVTADTEGRCPLGQDTLWIECGENVTDLKALEKLKEMLDKENTGETYTLIVYGSFSEDLKSFCQKQGWILDYGVTKVYGFECEVKCNIKVLII